MDPAEVIVDAIRRIPSGPGLFNHYESYESAREDADAPKLRRHNLGLYLRSFIERPSADLWIAEAPSRYGARWSGVPFTHQGKLKEMGEMLGMRDAFAVPTRNPESSASRTSAAIWKILPKPVPLLWNVVMLHPFKVKSGQIRNAETTREHHDICRDSLTLVLDTFKPRRIIAIGDVSAKALGRMGVSVTRVAHPGRNRHHEFWADMKKLGIGCGLVDDGNIG
ncbi:MULTISPECIES: hypothetical protein [unclassified Mesorhizobium]|uniref:hypothetical protein n=1 Tax=unclassified Mesorhizobium TaxID=325217 RepID=UPI000FD7C6CD|nr:MULTISPECIES: hypothetical protein [unclassified Mesorhizobium]TGQ16368.1 hypothetical protein EN862_002395 [Mesorhizobium sp. M2E.F.Ca.ET.219.01.1.1]TGT77535.1 hypothetical protein EN809_008165 [Mesorhizobium sp. M2E.F.Ca.ET.166.01.1.1]TGW03644.1 hypothetical protein EN797_008165 [Mesorhizobium sp. M2E.F.Ca.ET.154.01.1.1]